MSTIVTENLKRSSETASRSLRGVAAAWALLNGTGTISLGDSLNVASTVDNGTGDYSFNLSSAFSSVAYTHFATVNRGTLVIPHVDQITTKSSGVIRHTVANTSNSAVVGVTATDCSNYNLAAMGDLA